jgi:TRAP-type C4-dicarboxylate transport system permease small subunit
MGTYTKALCNLMTIIAGIVLLVMMVITFADIVMRYLGRPVVGAYEIVAFLGVAAGSPKD